MLAGLSVDHSLALPADGKGVFWETPVSYLLRSLTPP
jgi:hypothetical protein